MSIYKTREVSVEQIMVGENYLLEIMQKKDVMKYAVTIHLSRMENGKVQGNRVTIYEKACARSPEEAELWQAMQHFLENNLSFLCGGEPVPDDFIEVMEKEWEERAFEPTDDFAEDAEDMARGEFCRDFCSMICCVLEELAVTDGSFGVENFLCNERKRCVAMFDSDTKEYQDLDWILRDEDDVVVIVNAATATIYGFLDGHCIVREQLNSETAEAVSKASRRCWKKICRVNKIR